MPDWSYHPIFRPLLRFAKPEQARNIILLATSALARLPGGNHIFEIIGGMRPADECRVTLAGIDFPSRVGLGAGLDTNLTAFAAWPAFGFGFQEIGPVLLRVDHEPGPVTLQTNNGICYGRPMAALTAQAVSEKLQSVKSTSCKVAVRIGFAENSSFATACREAAATIALLSPLVRIFTLETNTFENVSIAEIERCFSTLVTAVRNPSAVNPALFLCLAAGMQPDRQLALLKIAERLEFTGVSISGGLQSDTNILVGPDLREQSIRAVQEVQARYGERFVIIGSGGIMEPADAQAYIAAGASLIQVHSGFVAAGPLLPKRINYVLAGVGPNADGGKSIGWVFAALFGGGLGIAAIAIGYVALTSVVLPYDTFFCGVSRSALLAYNPRLLPFMAHDRLTLAGILLSVGILYIGMARGPLRRARRWARDSFFLSGTIGIASFFLWFGYHYFDPLHALLTLILLPFFVVSVALPLPSHKAEPRLDLHNDRVWQRSHGAQLCFVIIGFGLIIGGVVISSIGTSSIFVQTDLTFLHTTKHVLDGLNPRLVPLVAHDRAGFGGALCADGIALLATALHGFERGAKWLWWTLLLAGIPGFLATICIHFAIGYTTFVHLLPVYFAAALYILGLIRSFAFLHDAPTAVSS